MSHLVTQQPATFSGTIRRFEPAYWELDFNTGMVATLVTTGPNSLRLKAVFHHSKDLVGLFWRSVDRYDHPLFSYQSSFDWTNSTLDFDLAQPTTMPAFSDITKGLTITVEDVGGNPYFVFLHNYQTSGGDYSGHFHLDFNTVKAGINADVPIPWTRVRDMFFGFTQPSFNDVPAHQVEPELNVTIDMTNITVGGTNSTIGIGDTALAAHELTNSEGFDDGYPQTPERIVRQLQRLGYRGQLVMYLGFSHYVSLTWISGRLQVDPSKPYINSPAQQWITDYVTHLVAAGITDFVASVSFEILASFAPDGWSQEDYLGRQAHSGWDPPSTFLTPCNSAVRTFLAGVAVAFVGLARAVPGCTAIYQVGEPWWWDGSFGATGPCIYDPACQAKFTAQTGLPVPTPLISSVYSDTNTPDQLVFENWLQHELGAFTLELRDAVRTAYPGTKCTVLFYTPQILDPSSPLFGVINFPKTDWASPAWDFVQVENYGVVTIGNITLDTQTLDLPKKVLGYDDAHAQYFSGFNLIPQTNYVWTWVDQALYLAEAHGYSKVVVWARPQVCRDGFVFDHLDWPSYQVLKPAPVYQAFPAVPHGFSVLRRPVFETQATRHVSGKSLRSTGAVFPAWEFTFSYEYLGSRDQLLWLQTLRGFYESMQGQFGAFQYVDPEFSHAAGANLGTGDGYNLLFALQAPLGPQGFVMPPNVVTAVDHVYVDGVEVFSPASWALSYDYQFPTIKFVSPPANGSVVTADFDYAFLCRFATDSQDFEEFMQGFHQATVTIRSFKP